MGRSNMLPLCFFRWEGCWRKRSLCILCRHNMLFLCSRTRG
uniref:Uncharacterized protein n=1 Tax=Arundo donax TaxID=35708 RepID=A0A0A9FJ42_ARUDO